MRMIASLSKRGILPEADAVRPDAKGASGNRPALYVQKQRTIHPGD